MATVTLIPIGKHAGFLRDARKRKKRLAKRISQKRYLEPKWLR